MIGENFNRKKKKKNMSTPKTCFYCIHVTIVIMYLQLLWLWRSREWTFLDQTMQCSWLQNPKPHCSSRNEFFSTQLCELFCAGNGPAHQTMQCTWLDFATCSIMPEATSRTTQKASWALSTPFTRSIYTTVTKAPINWKYSSRYKDTSINVFKGVSFLCHEYKHK